MAYTVASWGKRRRSSLACCAFWRPGALLTVVYCTKRWCRWNATNFNQLWPPPAIVLRLFVIGWRNSLRLRVRRVCRVTKNDPPTLTKLLKMVDDQKLEFYEVFKKLVTDILPMPLSPQSLFHFQTWSPAQPTAILQRPSAIMTLVRRWYEDSNLDTG